jgi:hypothetical protein
MQTYQIELTFTEALLGTVAKDTEIYTNFIASKGENTVDEIGTVPDPEQGVTGFHTVDGNPILYDYVIKGFFKDACSMLRRERGTLSGNLPAFKKVIDGLVFVKPRQITLRLPDGANLGKLERPLRAQTAQGERVALACSESAPAGTWLAFTLTAGGGVSTALLREWLDYGALRGLGQWRNGGYGTFTYTLEEIA